MSSAASTKHSHVSLMLSVWSFSKAKQAWHLSLSFSQLTILAEVIFHLSVEVADKSLFPISIFFLINFPKVSKMISSEIPDVSPISSKNQNKS